MLALIYLGLAICVGDRLCGHFYRFVSTAHRWATGALVGLLLSTGFTYLAARFFASTSNPLLLGDILFVAAASIFLLNGRPRRDPLLIQPRSSRSETWDWIMLGLYCALACWMMFATLNLKDGRIEIGVTQWSDYGPNTAIVQSFAFGHNFPAEYPHWAGEPIRYHFLFYFQAGNLEFLGLNLAWSVNFLSILTLVCMLALIMALGELLFRSRAVGVIASALFFFHGTLNLVPFLRAQTSFKGALLAIYHLLGYLSSGYPYRGEEWGIWTQVVFINQRHLASSIGIFLVVLFFLFDRYLERAKQRQIDRALAAGAGSRQWETALEPSVVGGIPARPGGGDQATDTAAVAEAQTFAGPRPGEHWSATPETSTVGEAQRSGTLESFEESVPVPNYAVTGETGTSGGLAHHEQSLPEPEARSVGGAELFDTVESLEEAAPAASYAPAGEGQTAGTVAHDQGPRPELGTSSVGESEPSTPVESFEGSSQLASYASAGEGQTAGTVAYDEGPRPEPGTSSVGESEPSTPVESFEGSSQLASYASAGEGQTAGTVAYDEGPRPEPGTSSVGEAEPSTRVESFEESSQPASYARADEAETFHPRVGDEHIHPGSEPTSASEAQESEALEFAKQSSQEYYTPPGTEAETSGGLPFVEKSTGEPDTASIGEAQSPPASASESVQEPSRGIIAQLVHDNLVLGRGFIFSGLLLGALPYWNSPVFTAAAAVLLLLFVFFPFRRQMVGLAITAAVLALPQVLALRSGNVRAGPALIHWGYTLGNVPVSQALKYLGWTFGVKWGLILIALIFFSWRNLRLFIAICSLFLLTFCFQFSDEILANHKFLNIWLVLANLFVAYGLWRLWHIRIKGWALPFRAIAILLLSPIVIGGVIDFFPIHNASFIETNYVKDRLIDWLRAETKPDAVFLSDKFVNHPILLAGRRIFFGYTYFTWSSGYNLPKREAAYKLMFESKNAHQVFTLLKANGIDYVAYDAGIRSQFKNSNEEQVYAPNFRKAFEGPEYWQLVIYKVPENADFIPATTAATAAVAGSLPAPGISAFEGGEGKEKGQFSFPRGLAVDSAGNILVADTNNGRIQKFSPTGVFLSVIGKSGQGPGEFQEPCGIAVDASGNIYVADVLNHRVQKLSADGTFIAEWKGPDPGFYGPRDLSVGPDNSVYVVDQGHSRIVKFDPNGKLMAVWGAPGTEDGQFGDATSVAVDGKNDRVYVADVRSTRIEVFDTNGKFIANWPVEEWRAQTGWYFQDLVIDSQVGRLYASSVGTDEVIVFDLTGKRIASLKPTPPDKLVGASSLALVKGKLYVLNTFGNYVSRIDVEQK